MFSTYWKQKSCQSFVLSLLRCTPALLSSSATLTATVLPRTVRSAKIKVCLIKKLREKLHFSEVKGVAENHKRIEMHMKQNLVSNFIHNNSSGTQRWLQSENKKCNCSSWACSKYAKIGVVFLGKPWTLSISILHVRWPQRQIPYKSTWWRIF